MCVLYDISSDHGKFRLLRTFQSIYFICLLFQVFTTQNYIYIYLFIECIVFTVSVYFCFLIMSYGQWFSWKKFIENKCSTNINNSTVINSLRYLITESKTILSKIELENRYTLFTITLLYGENIWIIKPYFWRVTMIGIWGQFLSLILKIKPPLFIPWLMTTLCFRGL